MPSKVRNFRKEYDNYHSQPAAKKQRDTIKLNDDYRAYCKTTESPISFIEFKSEWYKKKSDSKWKKKQKKNGTKIFLITISHSNNIYVHIIGCHNG